MENEGWDRCSWSARTLVSILATIIILLQPDYGIAKRHPPCPTSSCGQIRNISYPFRLKGDPGQCGDPRYELDCVNNATLLLTLLSGKYHVRDIDYNQYRMVVIDPGLEEEGNCSFIPRNFLTDRNFGSQPFNYDYWVMVRVGYLNCVNPVSDDPRYVKVERSGCGSGGHVYAVLDEPYAYSVQDMKVGCDLMVATLWTPKQNVTYACDRKNTETMCSPREFEVLEKSPAGNVTYDDIHRIISEGFWLSWLPTVCEKQCGRGVMCQISNESRGEVFCMNHYCNYAYHTHKCEPWQKIFGYIRGYLQGIIYGIGSRITFSQYPDVQYFDEGIFIGRNGTLIFFAARYLFGVVLILVLLIYKWRRRHSSIYENIENFLLDSHLNPIRYQYNEIKKMTRGFKVKLGQGGFGVVYKGKLQSGLEVAVKILSKSDDDGQDFINEVATIGTIHHINVVRLIGYCVHRKKCALVYEFMSNGSLDKYIFSKEEGICLSYDKIHEISLGIARGIAYLHQGCDMQILHFDIKPHNILLDDNFVPKVSDFGLAKLHATIDGVVNMTAARGTLGYMAPELFYNNMGGVTYKADVYSFGMLLMEMASKRRNSNPDAEHSSQHYFPFWIYDQFKKAKHVDMQDASEEDNILVKKMFLVALWCIQLKPSDRPSMNKVIMMLEGMAESLELPPRPSFYKVESYEHDDISSDVANYTYSTSHHGESLTMDHHISKKT
ncbi:LEAF RUST 10 DISEASE-RESISTANCE LOCUS RECEPTOR-LIKE PROTEIN KINASE-like 2.1 isoform X2 [Vigna unguiculata]|uniref:LEAF RUST 10 DISEASE-RESISTANCE LOCUS RECEPTOR-LIKE PROTEIN KINASE-like 2.1 isoform X2 n=1 Tax=Vigna unguiculata TaxID=3917 RepID=UPI0010171566|nr:LEAF RUST 10 DISEASE-RESISTANCE LOCUS RECEPTOR-LIKE PROTEIN KINASE-like 2.1 isoform X2 [Vigna unguiculata]